MKHHRHSIVIGSALLASLALGASTAFADTAATSGQGIDSRGGMMRMHRAPGVFGTVTAVSGTTITLTAKGFGPNASGSGSTYTVDASSATVEKDGAASTLASVLVGDTVMVEGSVSGTSVTATRIMNGRPPMMEGRGHGRGEGRGMRFGTSTENGMGIIPAGNGQPVVAGSVTSISGTNFAIANKAGASFTVDASSATVTKQGASSSVSAIAVGDTVIVQGTVQGSAIVANTVVDHGTPPAERVTAITNADGTQATPRHRGFFGMFGGFFGRFFGF